MKPNSPLFDLLEDQYIIHHQSLIRFKKLDFDLPSTDFTWVFFYSATGVRFFCETIDISSFDFIKTACFGPKTGAKLLEFIAKPIDFIGTGRADSTSASFASNLNNEAHVLFVRAKHSQRSVQKRIPNHPQSEVIVYDNTIDAKHAIPDTNILVFTSPMNAEAYMKTGKSVKGKILIAIGSTTADFMKAYWGAKVLVPAEPSEQSIANLLLSI